MNMNESTLGMVDPVVMDPVVMDPVVPMEPINRNLIHDFNEAAADEVYDYVDSEEEPSNPIWNHSVFPFATLHPVDTRSGIYMNSPNDNNIVNGEVLSQTYTPMIHFPRLYALHDGIDEQIAPPIENESLLGPTIETMERIANNNFICCAYCDSQTHRISECTEDPELIDLFYQEKKPDFFRLEYRQLKRMASHVHVKSSLPKLQLAIQYTRIWEHNNKLPYKSEDCAICMERLRKVNIAILPCGHEFCLGCLLQHSRSSHCCPLCREKM